MGAKRTKYYIDDDDLVYQLILSQGKGFPTLKLARMMILIADNFMRRLPYYNPMLEYEKDCYQGGLERMLTNYVGFNPTKYTKGLPYMTEIMKRGATLTFNQLTYKRVGSRLDMVSIEKYII